MIEQQKSNSDSMANLDKNDGIMDMMFNLRSGPTRARRERRETVEGTVLRTTENLMRQ